MSFKNIGFIGLGFVGGNLANNFKERGFKNLVLYDLSEKYIGNKEKIKKCDLVFISVPTPSTPNGFDRNNLNSALSIVADNSVVVLKSTIPPDVIRDLGYCFTNITIVYCPEFLTESTAKQNTDSPERNIVGISNIENKELVNVANNILKILPHAKYNKICSYEEASLAKYAGNCFFVFKNMFFNVLYELSKHYGADYNTLREMIINDSRIHEVHTQIIHKGGRGAGNHCLPKDMAMFVEMTRKLDNKFSRKLVKATEQKNLDLLYNSKKDLDLLYGIYGKRKYKNKN